MIRPSLAFGLLSLAPILLCQCGDKDPGPVLIGQSQEKIAEGEALYARAVSKESKGDTKGAIKLYEEVADDFPFCTSAGEARYRQAKLLDAKGERRDAFEAYDSYLDNFPSHPEYSTAIRRVFEIAIGAKRGDIQTNFLGLKGNLPLDETVEMLTSVKRHAPQSKMAAEAQYAIGELYLREKKYADSVAAFRKVAEDHRESKLAPEAMFRVGKILLEEASRGNQNQATIDLSKEAFNDYLIQFPGHKRNGEARSMIKSLGQREVQRAIEIADYYYKTEQWESAKIYYRDVLKRTNSGKAHDRAKARLKELGE